LAKRESVVGLDIGTTKVAAIVGEVTQAEPSIIGVGHSACQGMRRGVVVDIDGTSKAILQAVEIAQRMSGVEITGASISISGGHIASLNNRGVVAVSRHDREIAAEDVDRVLDAARVINLTSDREIIHVLPREFIVDGYDGVRDPVGMMGSRLEVEAHIISGATASIQNLMRAVSKAGLEIQDVILSSLAAGEAVLTPAEKELGVMLCDIGGGTTDVAISDRGALWYTGVIPLGGEHVTSDIAVGLRAPLPVAEQVKVRYGCAVASLVDDRDTFDLPNPSGRGARSVSERLLASIIEPRMEEILGLIGKELKKSGYSGMLPGGIVFTGGAARVRGLAELASEILDLPVRIGTPTSFSGLSDIVANPCYATGAGLVLCAARRGQADQPDDRAREGVIGGLVGRLKGWLSELF
jgi:cell division protein FtsA